MKARIQKGFLSFEVIIVMVVVLSGLSLGIQWLENDADMKINQAAAEHAKGIMDGAASMIKANYSTVQAAANPLATYTTTDIAGYLGSNFATVNPYGQSYSIRVFKTAANKLETMVVATGGEVISEKNIRNIAQLMGASGGYVSSLDTTKAQGAYGGWTMGFANYGSSPGGGKIAGALFFQDGQQVSDYLYRNAVGGHPELNQMNTALDMTTKDVNNVGVLSGKQAALSSDGAGTCCAPAGTTPTLMLSESTSSTGKKPTIQFHSAGYAEGYIALSGSGEPRRFNLRDNQGVGMGLDASGTITAPTVAVPGGNNLQVGSSAFYGDTANSAVRQNGSFYVQHYDGSPAPLVVGDIYANNGTLVTQRDYWAVMARNAAAQDNAQAQSANGSAYLNDAYFRSIGKWASQLGGYTNFFQVTGPNAGKLTTSYATCPGGTRMLSGGYQLVWWDNAENAPDVNIPDPGSNSWMITGSGSNAVFRPFAMCAS
ncbi:shufflon system plasmid conjugative transfer pilus tip adhesin PilV [Undibacterium arcticum]|uniref:Shufflon system plasmid conjugative transfer pilus tip adhesin PilV n=2 Tax=Undibacterium arcticum TaxID=1762892 RepID=A0ABV7F8K8_9BURK